MKLTEKFSEINQKIIEYDFVVILIFASNVYKCECRCALRSLDTPALLDAEDLAQGVVDKVKFLHFWAERLCACVG